MVQLVLEQSEDGSHLRTVQTTCWVKASSKKYRVLKPGMRVSLKNEDNIWTIISVSDPVERTSIKRGWNPDI
jgi:hypothetical protein